MDRLRPTADESAARPPARQWRNPEPLNGGSWNTPHRRIKAGRLPGVNPSEYRLAHFDVHAESLSRHARRIPRPPKLEVDRSGAPGSGDKAKTPHARRTGSALRRLVVLRFGQTQDQAGRSRGFPRVSSREIFFELNVDAVTNVGGEGAPHVASYYVDFRHKALLSDDYRILFVLPFGVGERKLRPAGIANR